MVGDHHSRRWELWEKRGRRQGGGAGWEEGERRKKGRKGKSKVEKGKSRLPWVYHNPFAMLTLCCLCPETAESEWKFGPWKRSYCVSVFLKMLSRSLMD